MKYTITITTGNAAMLTPGDVYDALHAITPAELRHAATLAETGSWSMFPIRDNNGNQVGAVNVEEETS